MRETNRNTFAFSFLILDLRHCASDKFHHSEVHQLFSYVGILCLNLGIESENNKHVMLKSQGCKYNLNF